MKVATIFLLLSFLFSSHASAGVTKPFGFFKKASKPSNIIMRPGDTLVSPNVFQIDNFTLAPQSDGNLVLYRDSDGAVMWYTNTWSGNGSCNACTLKFQTDGNLVLLDGANVKWSSYTPGAAGGYVEFRNFGRNIVIYNAAGIWHWNN